MNLDFYQAVPELGVFLRQATVECPWTLTFKLWILRNRLFRAKNSKSSYFHAVEKRKKSLAHRPSHLLSPLKILEFPSSPNLSFKLCASSPIPYRRIFYAFISALERPTKTAENRGRLLLYMENEDEEAVSHSPISDLLSNKTLTNLTATSLGLGLGFLYTRSPQTVKPISTAIKVSEAALKGSKSLTRISSPADLLFFSKYLMKISFAASTHFNCSPSLDTKKIKAYLGAVNLVRYMRFLPVVGIGVFDLGVLRTGYKLSKNFMKVLEGFLGIQLDSAVRNCVEVVELFVKTATVTREVSRIADWTGWKERLKLGEIDGDCSDVAENSTCRFVRSVDFDSGLCLNFERVELDGRHRHGFGDFRYSCLGFDLWEGDLNRQPSSETCLSDLFYLSIPVHIEILKHCL